MSTIPPNLPTSQAPSSQQSQPISSPKSRSQSDSSANPGSNSKAKENSASNYTIYTGNSMTEGMDARAREAEAENVAIQLLRDQFERQYQTESARQEALLTLERNRGYERLRELQREQKAEIQKIRTLGENESTRLRDYYQIQSNRVQHEGEKQLLKAKEDYASKVDQEGRSETFQLQDMKDKHQREVDQFRDQAETKITQTKNNYLTEIEKIRQNAVEKQQEATDHFNKNLDTTKKNQDKSLNQIEQLASDKINEIRQMTSEKLTAYGMRQQDPFYKLKDMNAQFTETPECYVLTATIPAFEQKHLSAVISGNRLVLSGYRSNEEKLDVSPGHTRGTASFQSYHESFPLQWPVDAHRLTRDYEGDQVIIRVPKKNEYVFKEPPIKIPEKARVEIPHFPENLPIVQPEVPITNPASKDGRPVRKQPSNDTLL